MVDIQMYIQTASIVITMLTVALGIGMGIIQFRNLVKTRRIQLYMDMYNRIMEKDMLRDYGDVLLLWKWKDTNDFWEKYEPIIIEMGNRWNTPKIMPMTEYLYKQIKNIRPRVVDVN